MLYVHLSSDSCCWRWRDVDAQATNLMTLTMKGIQQPLALCVRISITCDLCTRDLHTAAAGVGTGVWAHCCWLLKAEAQYEAQQNLQLERVKCICSRMCMAIEGSSANGVHHYWLEEGTSAASGNIA
jgi:hypothetical protein